ncbi:MAG: cobalt transporter [Clostridiales bacterium]|nr:cobalt transporter [Clostridiales bacterium]
MHLIQDENGNPVPHGHAHEHGGSHCPAADGTHTHCGSCEEHLHEDPPQDKMTAVLDYMLKHNEHHAAELDQVAEQFRANGKADAAEQIKKAVDEFQKGNLYLRLALSMVSEDSQKES